MHHRIERGGEYEGQSRKYYGVALGLEVFRKPVLLAQKEVDYYEYDYLYAVVYCPVPQRNQLVEEGYGLFLKRVAEGRRMSRVRVDSLAQGRVWTGQQALALKLVDANGTLDDAVEKAAQLAGTSNYCTVAYPEPQQWYQILLKDTKSNYLDSRLRSALGDQYEMYAHFSRMMRMEGVQARMPYVLNLINWN